MVPVQITLRDIPGSDALHAKIIEKAEKLNRLNKKLSSCRVVVELAQKHKHQGKLYNIRVDVMVPGKEIVVTRKVNEDIYVALREAFAAIERQLEEHAHKRHGRVKTHEDVQHGYIARMVTKEGYGFIEGVDGNEYYFSVTNVSHPQFEQLLIGDAVQYLAQPINDGWQANRVVKARHNHH